MKVAIMMLAEEYGIGKCRSPKGRSRLYRTTASFRICSNREGSTMSSVPGSSSSNYTTVAALSGAGALSMV